ncbi:MAG: hypothetical protein LC772_10005 [Chloroflexi bacterium]|nr:hypothetical protein [Chloroflexota bacterium]
MRRKMGTMTEYELLIAVVCIVSGCILQFRARKSGASDMQLLGAMLWIAGVILLGDCRWHFLTEPDH